MTKNNPLNIESFIGKKYPLLIISDDNYNIPWEEQENILQINIEKNNFLLYNKIKYWLQIHLFDCPPGFIKTSNNIFNDLICENYQSKIIDDVLFPFHPSHPVICTQGNLSNFPRSHFFKHTMYAIDLASPIESISGKIYASFDGIAYIYNKCKHSTTKNLDLCGYGYGNYIYLLRADGVYALYAHLDKIYVTNKQIVRKGQVLGLEGSSGMAGARHLHFSIHFFEGNFKDFNINTYSFSYPFWLNVKQGNMKKNKFLSYKLKPNDSDLLYADWDEMKKTIKK